MRNLEGLFTYFYFNILQLVVIQTGKFSKSEVI